MRRHLAVPILALSILVVVGCEQTTTNPQDDPAPSDRLGSPAAMTTVAAGLDNPRGIAFGPEGALYVAEAGRGGEGPCIPGAEGDVCLGFTGAVTRVWRGHQTRVAAGLPSLAGPDGGGAGGPHGISVQGRGNLLVAVGLGQDPAARDDASQLAGLAPALGTLVKVSAGGEWRSVADVSAHEASDNPDGGDLDSNPFGLVARASDRLVTDAGGNALVAVSPSGYTTTLAVFPSRLVPLPPDFGEGTIPMQSVPTSVAIGPDGACYVGELTGFPFPVGGARVYRVDESGSVSVYADGFTNVIGIAFAPDGSLLVLEIATHSLLSGDPAGALVRVHDGGRDVLASEGLIMPGGVAVGPDGAAYVSNCSVCAGGGTVERIELP